MSTLPDLSGQSWLTAAPLQDLLGVLSAGDAMARVAGGAVRNGLLGEPITDIDIATSLLPDEVMARAQQAGMSVHGTGLSHGTVTVVIHTEDEAQPFEVTTLRIDAETYGRHARVAFTDDWSADAARRDFTINAMYCGADGTLYDPLDGYADLEAGRIRFVGDAHKRIEEDHLRILRFFRFNATYGRGDMDETGLRACIDHKTSLAKLSGERIREELLKLMVAPRVVETMTVMIETEVFQSALPSHPDVARLEKMCGIDGANRLVPVPELRLATLVDPHATSFERLRLSNRQSERIAALPDDVSPTPVLSAAERKVALYRSGADGFCDAVRYRWALSTDAADDPGWAALLDLPDQWPVPVFPVSGKDLIARGFEAGPEMGEALQALEDWWIAAGFPDDKGMILAQLPS